MCMNCMMEGGVTATIRYKNNNDNIQFLRVKNLKINDKIQFDYDEIHGCDRLKVYEVFNTYIVFINEKIFTRKAILKSQLEKAKWHLVTWYEPIWSFFKSMRKMFVCSIYYNGRFY
jgi:hypothetical protein